MLKINFKGEKSIPLFFDLDSTSYVILLITGIIFINSLTAFQSVSDSFMWLIIHSLMKQSVPFLNSSNRKDEQKVPGELFVTKKTKD